jgi:hypothetical protein
VVLFKPEDFYDIGSGGSDFLKGTANAISNAVCGLYSSYPTGFGVGSPVAEGVNAFNRGLWDSFCGRMPNPQLPPVDPGGVVPGKCDGVVYGFRIRLYKTDGTPGPILGAGFGSDPYTYWGPIGIAEAEPTPDSSGSNIYLYSRGDDNNPILPYNRYLFTQTSPVLRAEVIELRRMDGQPDDCGSVGPSYPSAPPPPTNPYTYNHDNNDGTQSPINFEVDFDPTINGPLVRLPDIPNVCVGFGYGGIEIDLCTNKPGSGSGGDISEIEDKIDALRDILDRLEEDSKENLNKEDTDDNPPDQTDPENEPPDGGISKCVPNLRFVKVTLTNIPPNANVEVGQAGFDRIDDAGWFTFTKDGFFFPPQRIEFGGAIFEAPPGVECFTMQLRFGFTAVVTTVVKDS